MIEPMATDLMNTLSRKLLGKRLNDIALPNESGQTDPRLTPDSPPVRSQLEKAFRASQELSTVGSGQGSAVKALQQAGLRQLARERALNEKERR